MMKTIRLTGLALATLVALPALAQDGGGAAQPSAKEEVKVARTSISEMNSTLSHIEGLKNSAEAQADVARGACIDKQIGSLNLLIGVSEKAVSDMQAAYAEGNDGRAAAEGRKIRVAVDKSKEIRALAESCLGDEGSADTQTVVDYEGDERETNIDPQNTGIGNDPPGASPFE